MPKLSKSAISTFLQSPKAYFWRYVARLQPCQLTVANFDHDKLAGIIWSAAVDRFYLGVNEEDNLRITISNWLEQSEGWVPEKAKDNLTKALTAWVTAYYQQFSRDDGVRAGGSELWLENDRFCGILDGISADGVIHEVKSTSRGKQLSEQQWKVNNSIQVKLYCVLANATGYRTEFAYKDLPHQLFRGPIIEVTEKQRQGWEQELNTLADKILSMGVDEHNYPCHSDGCCLVTKNFVNMCEYQLLCEQGITEETSIFYKPKEQRK